VGAALAGRLLLPFFDARFTTFDEVAAALRTAGESLPRNQHAAFCALELALLDLAGKVFGYSAGAILGPVERPAVGYSGIVSAGSPGAALATCRAIQGYGFPSVKLKVGIDSDADLRILAGAREVLGASCSLRVDANGAWEAKEALQRIESFAPFRLDGVEQPIRSDDLEGLVWLAERSPLPIIVDESLVSLEDARRLADSRACHAFNIRISKCGGILNAGRIREVARAAKIHCILGAQVGETVLLSAAGRHFATRGPAPIFAEGSYGTLLLENDIGDEDLTVAPGGRAPALEGAGLGVSVREPRLAPYTTERREIMKS
jgi:muconate cycloisomerase